MSFRFPSDEWIATFSRLLNESSAKGCEGNLAFIVEDVRSAT